MYNCKQCKSTFEGNPYRKVGKGRSINLCKECSDKNTRKSIDAARYHNELVAARNMCIWCDDPLDDNRAKPKDGDISNLCVKCDSKSPYRQQLEKWLTSVGVGSEARIWGYLENDARIARWESIREEKRRKMEDQKNTKNIPAEIDPQEWEEFQSFLKFKRIRENHQ